MPLQGIKITSLKCLYFPVPKNGTSTIGNIFARHLGLSGDFYQAVKTPAFEISGPTESYYDFFKFAFVRNPLSRLVSCYLNKIKTDLAGLEPKTRQLYTDRGVFIYYEKLWPKTDFASMTFENFVDWVSAIPDEKSENHFCSQYRFFNRQDLDFIGRLETFETDLKFVLETLKLRSRIPYLTRTGAQESWRSYFTPSALRTACRRYQTDMAEFGYLEDGSLSLP
ncbi:MAG: sulfotransferase family 2 domain-containing protein [Candidatus Omnitrophota bacterium]